MKYSEMEVYVEKRKLIRELQSHQSVLKEKAREKARESIRDKLAKDKLDADRDNRERWEREGRIAPTKKHDMEL